MLNTEIFKIGTEMIEGNKLLNLFFMGVKTIEDLKVANLKLELLEQNENFVNCSREKALAILENFPYKIAQMPYTIARVFLMETHPSEYFISENSNIISSIVNDFQKYAFAMHDIFDNASFEAVKKLNAREVPEILVPAYCFLLIQKMKVSDVLNYIEKFPIDNLDNIYWLLANDNVDLVKEMINKGTIGILPLVNTYSRIFDTDPKFVIEKLKVAQDIEKYDFVISKFARNSSNEELVSFFDTVNIDLAKCPLLVNMLFSRNRTDPEFGKLLDNYLSKSKSSLEVVDNIHLDGSAADNDLINILIFKFLEQGKLDISICPNLQYHLFVGYVSGTQKDFDGLCEKVLSTESKLPVTTEILTPINIVSLIHLLTMNLVNVNIRDNQSISNLHDFTFSEKSGSKIVIQTRGSRHVAAIRIVNSLPVSYNRPYKIWSILYNLGYPVAQVIKASTGQTKEIFDIEVFNHTTRTYEDKSVEDYPYRVYSKFEGFNLSLIIKKLPIEWRWDILKQQINFYNELRKMKIWHGHNHAQNWCIKFIHEKNGKQEVLYDPNEAIKLKKSGEAIYPKAILIDFDKAVELGRSRYYAKRSAEITLRRVRDYLGLLLSRVWKA